MYNDDLTALVADQRRQQLIDEPAADRRARESRTATPTRVPGRRSPLAGGLAKGDSRTDLRGLMRADMPGPQLALVAIRVTSSVLIGRSNELKAVLDAARSAKGGPDTDRAAGRRCGHRKDPADRGGGRAGQKGRHADRGRRLRSVG